ncbi:MobA/MobL family protein, partial [Qipengyuania qiaonensis]
NITNRTRPTLRKITPRSVPNVLTTDKWKAKIVRVPEDTKRHTGGRWVIPARFGVPGPFSSRPVSAEGKVSFHFSHETVTKATGGKSVLVSGSNRRPLSSSATAEHDAYVTRPDAVLTLSAADFEQYAGRPGALGLSDGQTAAIFSNISDDPDERRDFWLKVHHHEREASPDCLKFEAKLLKSSEWQKLANADALPPEVRAIAARMAKIPARAAKSEGNAFLEIDLSEGKKITKAAAAVLGSWGRKRTPIRVCKGRGGRTQFRVTAEFPYGINAAARVRIAQSFCDYLAAFGVMYTAAIHAPDEHNDERNDHLHITYYDRPCTRLPDNRWDFEVREKIEGQHNRYRYPFRQPKISKLTRGGGDENYRSHRAETVKRMRTHFAEICNRELAEAGIARQFDPRSYREMGIEQQPTQPLGPRAAPLEAVGIPTKAGIENAEILWSFEMESARARCERAYRQRELRQREVAQAVDLLGPGDDRDALRQIQYDLRDACKTIDENEAELEQFRIALEMASARPEKTVETCERILATLDAGKGSERDRQARSLIEARLLQAEDFLERVDEICSQFLKEVAPIDEGLKAAREKVAALRAQAAPLIEAANSVATRLVERETAREQTEEIAATTGAVNPATTKLDRIMDRVLEDFLVHPPSERQANYTVPGIAREDYQMLTSESLSALAQARLKEIAKIQRARVVEAIQMLDVHGEHGLGSVGI